MEMTNSFTMRRKRQLNDAWAFLLFVITNLSTNIISLYKLDMKGRKICQLDLISLLIVLSLTFALLTWSFYALSYHTSLTLKSTLISLHGVLVYFITNSNETEIRYYICCSLIALLIYTILNWKKIDKISKILSCSCKIMLENHWICLLGILLCATLEIIQTVLTIFGWYSKFEKSSHKVYFCILVIFNYFWTTAVCLYFLRVFIASIISYYIIEEKESRVDNLVKSVKNTLYALGSICFAGFLIAIVKTLRLLKKRDTDDSRVKPIFDMNLRDRNIFYSILSWIDDIIEFVNELVMPYIAVNGCSYIDSMSKSWNLIVIEKQMAFCGTILLDVVFFILSLILSGLMYLVKIFCSSKKENVIFHHFEIITAFIFFNLAMSSFTSSYLALIYLYGEKPEIAEEMDEETKSALYEVMNNNKK